MIGLVHAKGTSFAGRTILITGATGFLGGAVARQLLAAGAHVRVLARSPAKARWLADEGATVVEGDVTDDAAVDAAVAGAAVVYHLAGRLLVPGVGSREYQRTHVEGTAVVLRCCHASPSLERLVHCSTTGVLGVTGDQPASENATIQPTNVYEATKAQGEALVRSAGEDGLPVVIARPGLVYGPGDLHLLSFFKAVLAGRFRPIGRRAVWLHPVYIDDVADAMIRCGEHPAAVGHCFHIAGRAPVSLAELAATIARAGGTRIPTGHIPLGAAQAAAAFGDHLPEALKRSAPLTRSRLDFLTHSRVYDVSKAERVLGFVAKTELESGMARTMAWYREQGHLPPSAWRKLALSA